MKNKYTTDKNSISTRWLGYHKEIKDFLVNYAVLSDLEKEKNVDVIYSSPSNAFTKYITPLINGQAEKPVLTYILDDEKMVDTIAPFMKPFNFYRNGNTERVSGYHPIIKELTYTCNLFTKTMSQADSIITRLELECNAFKPKIIKVNSKRSELYLDSVKNNTNINIGAGEKRLIFYTFTLKIPRAYISPIEVETDSGIVREIMAYIGIDQEQEKIYEI